MHARLRHDALIRGDPRLRAAPAQDTTRLQKKITAFEAEVKLKQTLVTKLEADLAAAREAARVAEAELRTAKQELAGVVPLKKKSRRDEVPINAKQSRAPNVDAFVQEKRAQIDQAAAEKRLRDEAAAERRFRESAERRRELEKARSERQVSQAKKMLARDEEKQLYGETLYDLLGVARTLRRGRQAGISKAAAACHPDTNSSNPEKYSRIMDAYDARFCVRNSGWRKTRERTRNGEKYDAELDLDKAIEGTFTFVASVVDSVSSINSPSEDDEELRRRRQVAGVPVRAPGERVPRGLRRGAHGPALDGKSHQAVAGRLAACCKADGGRAVAAEGP